MQFGIFRVLVLFILRSYYDVEFTENLLLFKIDIFFIIQRYATYSNSVNTTQYANVKYIAQDIHSII